MKKYLILLAFFLSVSSFAQIVNIPDANFKAKLIALGIDTNLDNDIQVVEALAVTNLDVSISTIADLTGIESFTNLIELRCMQNNLTSLNLSSLSNLTVLYANGNQLSTVNLTGLINLSEIYLPVNLLTNIDLNGLTNLTKLDLSGNLFTSIDLSNLTNLTELYCGSNQLTNLNVSSLVNLTALLCDQNLISALNLNNLAQLQKLYCNNNQISNLQLTNLTQLTELYCQHNQLVTLDVTGLVNLVFLHCYDNLLTSLDVSFNPNLTDLNCDSNQLVNLNLQDLVNLSILSCFDNQLTSINLINTPELLTVNCENNLLTTIDLSSSSLLNSFHCDNNLLQSIFIKNGSDEQDLTFTNNPSLNYICADDSQIQVIQNQLLINGMTTATCNSYCSFVPGGNYNTISGVATFDADDNGCDSNDILQPNIKININDGINQGTTFTNSSGNYTFYTQTGSFNIIPAVENPTFFNFTPSLANIPFADNNNNAVTQNFCITPVGIHHDIEIVIAPITPARPGFDAMYQIVFKNKSNVALSGDIEFTYNDEFLDFVTASTLPDSQSQGMLSWNYQNLQPFENRSIYVTLNVNSPPETPAVNIGDVLNFEVNITPVVTDENTVDNVFNYNQTVVGSFDPNDITCIEGQVVPPSEIGEYLHYIINFENTGTAEAENIVVKVEIDENQFDIDSLQLLNTSHNAYIRQAGNKVEFIFQEIWLDTGGHGNVLLKIKSKNNLLQGDAVAKQANIYFDYNFPIETNIANTIFEVLGNIKNGLDDSIVIYPNPTNSVVHFKCNNNIKLIQLYDVQGRLLHTQIIDISTTSLDLSERANGIYFAKITSEKGMKVEKISKE
jgi:Leucine-rich repeat (LRR) protein